MDEYRDKFVPPDLCDVTIENIRGHSDKGCKIVDLCECSDIVCDECVYDTLANTVDYLFSKGYIDKAVALELTLSGINKD